MTNKWNSFNNDVPNLLVKHHGLLFGLLSVRVTHRSPGRFPLRTRSAILNFNTLSGGAIRLATRWNDRDRQGSRWAAFSRRAMYQFITVDCKLRGPCASGMAGWTEPMTLPDMFDLEKSTALLALQVPWWEPGTAFGYHTFTIGL